MSPLGFVLLALGGLAIAVGVALSWVELIAAGCGVALLGPGSWVVRAPAGAQWWDVDVPVRVVRGDSASVRLGVVVSGSARWVRAVAGRTGRSWAVPASGEIDWPIDASRRGLHLVGPDRLEFADPFGLRRAALGIVNSLIATQTDFSVRAGLGAAARLQPLPVADESIAETATFVERRLEGVLHEMGYAHDVVAAVLVARGDNPAAAVRAADAITAAVAEPEWSDTFTAYARCARITRTLDEPLTLNPAAYVDPREPALQAAYEAAAAAINAAAEPATVLWAQLHALRTPINAYFDKVLINAENPALRTARLALVQRIAALPTGAADLSKLQGF